MSAQLLAFPARRRVHMIERLAAAMVERDKAKGENLLRSRLDRHCQTLARKGVAIDLIAADVVQMEGAVRAELWRIILTEGREA
jgi:ribosomal protein L32